MPLTLPNPEVFLTKRTKVYTNEITWLEADANYTRIYFDGKAPLLLPVTLKKVERILIEHGFMRVHKKFMVSPNFADYSFLSDGIIILPDNISVKISRRKRSTVRRKVKNKKEYLSA